MQGGSADGAEHRPETACRRARPLGVDCPALPRIAVEADRCPFPRLRRPVLLANPQPKRATYDVAAHIDNGRHMQLARAAFCVSFCHGLGRGTSSLPTTQGPSIVTWMCFSVGSVDIFVPPCRSSPLLWLCCMSTDGLGQTQDSYTSVLAIPLLDAFTSRAALL